MKEIVVLFYVFAKVGILGYGGGHSMIPLIQIEVVDKYKWLTIEEFTEALAMANSLPGPITIKMSIFTGYKIAGMTGSGASIVGLILPSLILMLTLTIFYLKYKDLPAVKGSLKGIKPVVIALLVLVVYNIFPSRLYLGLFSTGRFCAILLCELNSIFVHLADIIS